MKFLNNYCQKGTFSMNFSTISFFSKCFQRSSSSGFLITCSFLIYFFPPYIISIMKINWIWAGVNNE
ncbi:MAG TPA: hypothetical protein PKZ69_02755, partial [Candidatus Cloacimonadota bacterium]|nr:hypothetical protein [Candidatus Cloacimonadota bacterium]